MLVSVILLLVVSSTVSAASTKSGNAADVLDACVVPGGMPAIATGEPPGQRLKSCRQQNLEATSDVRLSTKSVQLNATVCPVDLGDIDIVVDSITALRAAVTGSPAGTVIGIDGLLDINADGLGDVVVSAAGVTLTCASDGAGLTGTPTAAMLWVQADNVTVKYLAVSASTESGIVFGSNDPSSGISADNGTVSHNTVACVRTCIRFDSTDGAEISHNDLTAPGKNFGIAARQATNVAIVSNVVSDCGFICISALGSSDVKLAHNDISVTDYAGMLIEASHNVEVYENRLSECSLGFYRGFCLLSADIFGNWGQYSSNLSVRDNDFLDCSPAEGFVDFDNNIYGGAALCIIVLFVDKLTINDNQVRQSATWVQFDPENGFWLSEPAVLTQFTTQVEVKGNAFSGGYVGFDDSEGTLFADNVLSCDSEAGLPQCSGFTGTDIRILNNDYKSETGTEGGPFPAMRVFFFGEDAIEISNNKILGKFSEGISLFGFGYGNPNANGGEIAFNDIRIAANGFVSPNSPLVINAVDGLSVRNNHLEVTGGPVDSPVGWVPSGIWMRGQVNNFKLTDTESGEVLFEIDEFAPARDNLIANNRIIGQGIIGVELFEACANTFIGNNFKGEEVSAVLFQRVEESGSFGSLSYEQAFGGTGANTFAGSATIVEANPTFPELPLAGNGYLDCNGDGIGEPNIYVKGSRPVGGFGPYISAAVSAHGGSGE